MEEDYSCYIYIAFFVTNTNIGKMIRLFTRNKFSHVTLAFDRNLNQMYSFARYHVNSPIRGGFVIEEPARYLYNENDATVKLCRIPVTENEYNRILKEVTYFKENREKMIYNTLNAVLSLLKKQVTIKDAYTCLEFVNYILRLSDILVIRELERKFQKYVIYQGSFRELANWEQSYMDETDYFERRHALGVVRDTVGHFTKVAYRFCLGR